ncbi:MAG TPA: hypothetical protein VFM33_13905 [Aquabacterium sp.]|nr:hypothetical protein [Aquabacterium sp.]
MNKDIEYIRRHGLFYPYNAAVPKHLVSVIGDEQAVVTFGGDAYSMWNGSGYDVVVDLHEGRRVGIEVQLQSAAKVVGCPDGGTLSVIANDQSRIRSAGILFTSGQPEEADRDPSGEHRPLAKGHFAAIPKLPDVMVQTANQLRSA